MKSSGLNHIQILASGGEKKAGVKNSLCFNIGILSKAMCQAAFCIKCLITGAPKMQVGSSPGNSQYLFILSLGSTATMHSMHRLHLVASKCQETAENCKCFWHPKPTSPGMKDTLEFQCGNLNLTQSPNPLCLGQPCHKGWWPIPHPHP